ncbi:hypothetical protein [Sutcliffiella sp. NC1]|uniref:hypothetical protein n=1 Tax=Sutcliffiella sp. NC1 TaxID=3004096 RepID=UPI0022DE4C9C|nr:hypothetical protein [Sutcliffiella sp. NC1]WBL16392.1 hypothetical protein O1A01_07095 [Sutcliffiella sp. NC1]
MKKNEIEELDEIKKKVLSKLDADNIEDESFQLIVKMLNMQGETIDDIDKINIGDNGEIVLLKGKLNVEKFIKMTLKNN